MKLLISPQLQIDCLEIAQSISEVDKAIENSIGFQLTPLLPSYKTISIKFFGDASSGEQVDQYVLEDVFPLGLQIGIYSLGSLLSDVPNKTLVVLWSQVQWLLFEDPVQGGDIEEEKSIEKVVVTPTNKTKKRNYLQPGFAEEED